MILDTTFLIDVLRGESTVEDTMERVDETGTASVSAVSVMELWEGVHLTESSAEERDRVEELLDGLYETPFDRECGKEAGRISAELVTSGQGIEDADVMIAATALLHDEPVLTRNTSHFERIDGLDVRSY